MNHLVRFVCFTLSLRIELVHFVDDKTGSLYLSPQRFPRRHLQGSFWLPHSIVLAKQQFTFQVVF